MKTSLPTRGRRGRERHIDDPNRGAALLAADPVNDMLF